jgi:G3E family GTPase
MAAVSSGKTRFVLIGGFLGAGKTTAVSLAARYLTGRGIPVGVISNDQSAGLVDTAVFRSQGFDVEEIAGGCFCCRFDSVVEAAQRLAADKQSWVCLAEPVGSCTDLAATVGHPLTQMFGDRFTVAPVSVLVDPTRAARILGLATGRSFSDKVVYVYRKQLEEADLIVVNKCDVYKEPQRSLLAERLQREFPRAEVLCLSARTGKGMGHWVNCLLADEFGGSETMEVDYERYADGEAALGWLNCTARVTADEPFDGAGFLSGLSLYIRDQLRAEGREIAHLKIVLNRDSDGQSLLSVNLTTGDDEPEVHDEPSQPTRRGDLIINLRAEADPDLLDSITRRAVDDCGVGPRAVNVELTHLDCFRPAKPTPLHRVSVPS